jgi:hypothetical protein
MTGAAGVILRVIVLSLVFTAQHPDQWILDLFARLREPILRRISEPDPGGLSAGFPSLLRQPGGSGAHTRAPTTVN